MGDKLTDLPAVCSRFDFGAVHLSREAEAFRGELNRVILSLCESLPDSSRTEAALFLMKYLQAPFSGGLNFVNYFYAPTWSILFWLLQAFPDDRKLDPEYVQAAQTGHTMAMFLHAFDDHLTDGQLPLTHLALLLRSQAWMNMNRAFERLARDVTQGSDIVRGFIDDYYASIAASVGTQSLNSYCDLFRKQMATGLIVPIILAKRLCSDEAYAHSIEAAYCSFGIAWRLLDDIQDLENDMHQGVHSAIYVCLNTALRDCWDKNTTAQKGQNGRRGQTILRYILEKGVIESLQARICSELDSAAARADACSLPELAGELRCLLKPLREGPNHS